MTTIPIKNEFNNDDGINIALQTNTTHSKVPCETVGPVSALPNSSIGAVVFCTGVDA